MAGVAMEDEREEELSSITAIFPELTVDPSNAFAASLELPIAPTNPLLVRFIPQSCETTEKATYASAAANGNAYIERDVYLSHLPPLNLQIILPDGYPADKPPDVPLATQQDWLPKTKLRELEQEAAKLWVEYGQCQILFSYIDYLQQAAERGFDLDQSAEGCLVLPVTAEPALVTFNNETKQKVFDAGTYDCGICLEPKKGTACYKLSRCGHVFCKQCLQDFYVSAITEGDVATIRCLDPGCGKEQANGAASRKRKRRTERTLHPRELLAMGIDDAVVRRYVEMKRKKKLEADKTTVYCPRTWCQGPARSAKYPPIPADLSTYAASSSSSGEDTDVESPVDDAPPAATRLKKTKDVPPDPTDRLAVCEKCNLAFCRVCYMGWHGPYARCFPRDPNELSAEEKASYDYIRMNTSPCPTCSSPTQKTMGCNHMKCFQCNTHFCYLCGAWLDGQNPYQHFNKAGTQCYQRLWELEEGDEGQGPQDGRGFAGGRGWEQMALEVARQADEQEAEAAAQAAQVEEDERAARLPPMAPEPPVQQPMIEVMMAQVHLDAQVERQAQQRPRGGRRGQNPFHGRAQANGAAAAERQHERQQANRGRRPVAGDGPVRRRPAANEEERQQQELQRFLEMAQRDEEDGWDSDELDEDDDRFAIR